jgi:hypothetical protein
MLQRHASTAGSACCLGGHLAVIIITLLNFASYVNCNNFLPIMVTTRAVTTVAKIQKHRAAKATKITSHQHCFRGNSSSPPGNKTPLNIAELNLNHPRYENVLETLGTPDEAGCTANIATDPLDDIEDLTLLLDKPTLQTLAPLE